MTINGYNYGHRGAANVNDEQGNWFSVSIAQDGSTALQDFGHAQQDIVITFNQLTGSGKNRLQSYLQGTVKQGNPLSISPDTGDDLQVGATGATTFTYLRYKATRLSIDLWKFEIFVRKYT